MTCKMYKGYDLCYSVCWMVHIKYPLLLIENSSYRGARCSSVVRSFTHGAMGRRIDPSWGGPIVLFLVPASAPRLVPQRLWYSVCWMVHIKYPLLLIENSSYNGSSRFTLSQYPNGPLPDVRHQRAIIKMC